MPSPREVGAAPEPRAIELKRLSSRTPWRVSRNGEHLAFRGSSRQTRSIAPERKFPRKRMSHLARNDHPTDRRLTGLFVRRKAGSLRARSVSCAGEKPCHYSGMPLFVRPRARALRTLAALATTSVTVALAACSSKPTSESDDDTTGGTNAVTGGAGGTSAGGAGAGGTNAVTGGAGGGGTTSAGGGGGAPSGGSSGNAGTGTMTGGNAGAGAMGGGAGAGASAGASGASGATGGGAG